MYSGGWETATQWRLWMLEVGAALGVISCMNRL
jgi:hypothetical protein